MEYFAISNGIPVHILDTKKGETTIVLLHGYLETLYIFNELIEMLEKRYAERYPIYTGTCDVHVKNDSTAEALAEKIIADFEK